MLHARYEPLGVVGRGGQGEVLRARDTLHDRIVAIKVRRVLPERRDALLREARVLYSLRPHPSISIVREDFFEDDEYHLVMDWIDGRSLADRSDVDADQVLTWLADVAEALDHLHEHAPAVVHGDVKPASAATIRWQPPSPDRADAITSRWRRPWPTAYG